MDTTQQKLNPKKDFLPIIQGCRKQELGGSLEPSLLGQG